MTWSHALPYLRLKHAVNAIALPSKLSAKCENQERTEMEGRREDDFGKRPSSLMNAVKGFHLFWLRACISCPVAVAWFLLSCMLVFLPFEIRGLGTVLIGYWACDWTRTRTIRSRERMATPELKRKLLQCIPLVRGTDIRSFGMEGQSLLLHNWHYVGKSGSV